MKKQKAATHDCFFRFFRYLRPQFYNFSGKRGCEKALRQIDEKKYDAELIAAGVISIHKIGIAFHGKHVAVKKQSNG